MWRSPLSALMIVLIHIYRWGFSWMAAGACRFTPTCSAYALESYRHFGFVAGSIKTAKRLSRCHPWCEGGFDPVFSEGKQQ